MYFLVEDCANGIWEDEKLPSVRFSSKVWLTLLLLVPLCHLLEITERRSFHFSTMLEWVVGNVKKKKLKTLCFGIRTDGDFWPFAALDKDNMNNKPPPHYFISSPALTEVPPTRRLLVCATGLVMVDLIHRHWTGASALRLLRVLVVLETLPSEFF